MTFAKQIFIGLVGVTMMTGMLSSTVAAFEPNKPVEFIIMAGKGGGADKMARLLQAIVEKEKLSSRPLFPTNKSGGSGAEALIAAKNANDPDHTIMVTLNSFFTTPLRQPGLRIDNTEFAPIGRMAEDSFLLWVNKDSGITTFEQYLQVAKADGSKWVMGGTGRAGEDNIITNYLNNEFGLTMKYIPYQGGGEVAKQVAGNQLNSSVNNPSEALGFYESGDLVPLVAFTDERLPLFPDVPTLKELGSDFSYFMQRAVVGAPGMSEDALAYYTDLFTKVYASADWQDYKTKQSLMGEFMSGDQLRAYWDQQNSRHTVILKASGDIK
ncbi:MAG: tripartite tricarboxylate transporter substrate binding protein [Kordiimonadaceae bacterium]|nr:tripartite tricarboxylate transporter substrate binding protein [Kordiimonadaceae bacterium]MBT6037446.1 tripartite tricarboxylate transporter substrate binding protein [Kordiimonadaceae bacterium]MBT6330106.1 tripartite tricarboxylate transporter substrate binding protein [Kordiimonadaceae bacterium]MBT7582384.1 tripartite tricarboxylate transporter substrate binding protein [Kordiimonadaceae bacterium]